MVRSSRRWRAGVHVRHQIYLVTTITTITIITTPLRHAESTASAGSVETLPRQARAATALTALARRETPAQVAEMVVALAHRKTRSGAGGTRVGDDETAQRKKNRSMLKYRTFLAFSSRTRSLFLGAVVRRRFGQNPLYSTVSMRLVADFCQNSFPASFLPALLDRVFIRSPGSTLRYIAESSFYIRLEQAR